jgi:hypothetical protein
MSAEDPLERTEELLARLEAARAELVRLAATDNAEAAVDVLTELAEIARQVEVELARARRESGAA